MKAIVGNATRGAEWSGPLFGAFISLLTFNVMREGMTMANVVETVQATYGNGTDLDSGVQTSDLYHWRGGVQFKVNDITFVLLVPYEKGGVPERAVYVFWNVSRPSTYQELIAILLKLVHALVDLDL